jgi:hypothetical protein
LTRLRHRILDCANKAAEAQTGTTSHDPPTTKLIETFQLVSLLAHGSPSHCAVQFHS